MIPFATILVTQIGLLLMLCSLPSQLANQYAKELGRLVTLLCGSLATMAAIWIVVGAGETLTLNLADWWPSTGAWPAIYYDNLTSLMLGLVTFVGFVVGRYSIRYLDGEANQGRYFKWLAFTIGAVCLLVVSGNLLLFFAAWVLTSLGLHNLLLHYPDRQNGRKAAWTKFWISRLGDGFLIAALITTQQTFGTLDVAELFQLSQSQFSDSQLLGVHAMGWFFILGAIAKSAQFPFHVWLPETMETPTPVSALMHAGVVNAGGYLVIRFSPLIAHSTEALFALAIVGAVTTVFAGVVMMTQPAIKRSLAYSTIAQMGFMMLQCGLGSFSTAMLHIIAHSLYKAYAFLNSGSVLSERSDAASQENVAFWGSLPYVIAASAISIIAYGAISFSLGIDQLGKSGGLALGVIFCIALTTWGWRLLTPGKSGIQGGVAIGGTAVLALTYLVSYAAVHSLIATAVPAVAISTPMLVAMATAMAAFTGLLVLQLLVASNSSPQWLEALRVHAVNGFYFKAYYHRLFDHLQKS